MRFFADHCVPESVAEALESKGHEVLRLRNQMATDAPDPDVIEKAQMFDAVLLSLNGDFSDIVRYPPSKYGGIISMQVRNRPEVLAQIMDRLTRYLRDQSDREHYRGKLLLVEAHRIRVRGAT
jgi:predicted nuclease of predicted toxin-antitoxin system